jgi:MFS family permease
MSRWWMVSVLCAAGFISFTDRLILSALVDPIRRDLALGDVAVSVLQGAAFAVVYVLAGLPLGRFADRSRRINLLILGSVTWSLGTVACGLAPGFWTLGAARLIVGVGEAALAPCAVSLLADTFPASRRGVPMGLLLTAMVVGGPVGVTASGLILDLGSAGRFSSWPLLGEVEPWRQALILLGSAGLMIPLLCLTLREPVRRDRLGVSPSVRITINYFLERRRLLFPLYAGMALLSVGDYGILSWMPTLLTRRFHWDASHAGALFGTVCTAAGIVGCFGGGVLFDRAARAGGAPAQFTLLASAAALGMLGAALLAVPSARLSLAGLALWILASNVAGVAGITIVQGAVPNEIRGTSISLVAFCNTLLGLGIGPSLVALVTERVYGDASSVGFAMATAVVPAAAAAAVLFQQSRKSMKSLSPIEGVLDPFGARPDVETNSR